MLKKLFNRSPEAAITNIKTCFYSSLFIGLLAAVLRCIALVTSFDAEIGYFDGSLLPALVNYLMIIGCMFAVAFGFVISKDARFPAKLSAAPNSVFFTSCFAGFVLIADFVYKLLATITEGKFEDYKNIFAPGFVSDNTYFTRAAAVIEIFGMLASLLSAIYFFLRASKKAESKLTIWLGFFPVIRALVGVATIYFEMAIQMNHPSKFMLQFALIALMLCLLYEQRFGVADDHARPRLYFVSGCIAFVLAFTGGVSEMFGFFTGYLKRGDFCVEAFFCLTISFYILARINSFVNDASRPAREISDETGGEAVSAPEDAALEESVSEEPVSEDTIPEDTVSE